MMERVSPSQIGLGGQGPAVLSVARLFTAHGAGIGYAGNALLQVCAARVSITSAMYAWNKWSRSTRLAKGRGRQASGMLRLAGTLGSGEHTPMPQMTVAIPRWDFARGAVAMLDDRRASVGAAVATLAAAWCASTECSASALDAFLGPPRRLPEEESLPTRAASTTRAIMTTSKMGQPVATQGMMETRAGGRPWAALMITVGAV